VGPRRLERAGPMHPFAEPELAVVVAWRCDATVSGGLQGRATRGHGRTQPATSPSSRSTLARISRMPTEYQPLNGCTLIGYLFH